MPVVFAALLAVPTATLPGDRVGVRRFQTPPLGAGLRLAQTFVMPIDGLHRVEVYPVATSSVSGDMRFELYEIQPVYAANPVHRVRVPAAQVTSAPVFPLDFAPIHDSSDRTYRLEIETLNGTGPAFWATKGERYDGGTLQVNGRDRWSDLAFRTYAPVPSVWGRLMTLRASNPIRAWFVVVAFAAMWLALRSLIRTLETLPA
jgi:hypothetical protein